MIVNGETAFLMLRARSYMSSVLSELERSDSDIYAANTAAFNLAMAAELTLKHVLLSNGIEPSRTHSHAQLIKECGENHISVPKELRVMTIDLRTWESTTRYDSGVVIEKTEVEAGYAVVKNYMDRIYADFIKNAYEMIKIKLSSGDIENKTPEAVVIQNLKLL
ncbi:MAG: HEPN domain-containing protein [Lachnospiraceae bacterium]|nr:HEPN domain-containing protein [Lachnospiraceae bacterium]